MKWLKAIAIYTFVSIYTFGVISAAGLVSFFEWNYVPNPDLSSLYR